MISAVKPASAVRRLPPGDPRSIRTGSAAHPAVLVIGRDAASEQEILHLARAYPVVVLAWHVHEVEAWLASQASNQDAAGDRRQVICAGELEVDLRRHQVWLGTAKVPVTERELKLLAVLAGDPERAWTFDELAVRVWGYDFTEGAEVRSAIKRLRKKLAAIWPEQLITSVRGVGFCLNVPGPAAPELPTFRPQRGRARS